MLCDLYTHHTNTHNKGAAGWFAACEQTTAFFDL